MKKNIGVCRMIALGLALWMLFGAATLLLGGCAPQVSEPSDPPLTPDAGANARLEEKLARLEDVILTHDVEKQARASFKGATQTVVFLSVCNTLQRALVFTGVGSDLTQAWADAVAQVRAAVASDYDAAWVKADVVCEAKTMTMASLSEEIVRSRHEFYRWGVAFDEGFETALLEAELNGAKIYEYENGGIDLSYLNKYLKKADRETLDALPDRVTVFRCLGWLCDDTSAIHALNSEGLEYGRREIETVDDDFVETLLSNASAFLVDQVKENGSFVYGIYPRFDNEIKNYNIVRHASTLWSLICRYRLAPDAQLEEVIDRTFDYMLTQLKYDGEDTAYLYEKKSDEIKLGGCGVAIIAMTEYMDAFGNDKYTEICRQIGNGILTMLDQTTGEYYHVLNGNFTRKEEYRTVYYDGEATFALCRLYSLTGEEKWLNAAVSAVDHFIEEDYTLYRDHWIAYSMNEITKHVTDKPEYYAFALRNVQDNVKSIYARDTTYHTFLELLMVSFELYDRMLQNGIEIPDGVRFDEEMFLKTIYARADRMLNGYFFPEYAMYMENPASILNTFMVRHDGYRVRIDDVQHNIGGFYLYYKHYDRLVELGMLDCRDR